MQQTVLWLQTWTAAMVLLVLAAAFIVGLVLRALVKKTTLHPSHALRVIRSVAVIVGGGIGSVVVLLLLIILWPGAGNWVINTFLSDTLIWQTEFQQWITQKINDPMTSSAIGLLIQRVQFGMPKSTTWYLPTSNCMRSPRVVRSFSISGASLRLIR